MSSNLVGAYLGAFDFDPSRGILHVPFVTQRGGSLEIEKVVLIPGNAAHVAAWGRNVLNDPQLRPSDVWEDPLPFASNWYLEFNAVVDPHATFRRMIGSGIPGGFVVELCSQPTQFQIKVGMDTNLASVKMTQPIEEEEGVARLLPPTYRMYWALTFVDSLRAYLRLDSTTQVMDVAQALATYLGLGRPTPETPSLPTWVDPTTFVHRTLKGTTPEGERHDMAISLAYESRLRKYFGEEVILNIEPSPASHGALTPATATLGRCTAELIADDASIDPDPKERTIDLYLRRMRDLYPEMARTP